MAKSPQEFMIGEKRTLEGLHHLQTVITERVVDQRFLLTLSKFPNINTFVCSGVGQGKREQLSHLRIALGHSFRSLVHLSWVESISGLECIQKIETLLSELKCLKVISLWLIVANVEVAMDSFRDITPLSCITTLEIRPQTGPLRMPRETHARLADLIYTWEMPSLYQTTTPDDIKSVIFPSVDFFDRHGPKIQHLRVCSGEVHSDWSKTLSYCTKLMTLTAMQVWLKCQSERSHCYTGVQRVNVQGVPDPELCRYATYTTLVDVLLMLIERIMRYDGVFSARARFGLVLHSLFMIVFCLLHVQSNFCQCILLMLHNLPKCIDFSFHRVAS
ncbi:hypothetical protein DFH11DRAFT_1542987 [Phellopilus nigrolimitatus]|nr:hypothetical protein DFH11DRAFT_1542987 [Phellopilus nigrolimitatus]